jgi:molecular chaperone DnaJ
MAQRDYVEKDYYATLGVSKDASESEIDKAYRKLARQYHPDANPDDPQAEQKFKDISEAHSVLGDSEKRAEYDQVRQMAASGGFGGGSQGGFRGFGGAGFPGGEGGQTFDLGDIFGDIFGQGRAGGGAGATRGRTRPQRGRDIQTELTLSFEDAMAGATTTLRIASQAPCSSCGGSGARPGTSPVVCPECQGTGSISANKGLFGLSEPCPSCGGAGRQIPEPCPTCQGSGVETRPRDVKARIPAGVKDGARVRLKGKGQAGGQGAPAGDLYVTVHVSAHELFARHGDNLTLSVPITFPEAALGTRLTVPSLDGAVTLKIPAGTESGKTFRVKGRGAPISGKRARGRGRGDLLVTVEVEVPKKLTKTQKQHLEDFAATTADTDVRAHLNEWLDEPEEAAAQ